MNRWDFRRHKTRATVAAAVALVCGCLGATRADAGVRRVWAVNDGVKVDRDARNHPARNANSAWDGRRVRVFAARNEVLAFQLIVEANDTGIKRLAVSLPRLNGPDGNVLVYKAPALDPTDYVDRPIQLFVAHYMNVAEPRPWRALWVFDPAGLCGPLRGPIGWKPVQLVPENARQGRGGFPIESEPLGRNQALWIEVYIPRGLAAGMYDGVVELRRR